MIRARQCRGRDEANYHTEAGQREAVAYKHPLQRAAFRAERGVDSDLTAPLRDHVGDHADRYRRHRGAAPFSLLSSGDAPSARWNRL